MMPIVTIGKVYKFDAAHFIEGHKGLCKNVHGHTYTMTIELKGHVGRELYMVIDFYDLNQVVKALLASLDHSNLNDAFEKTTAEFMTVEIAKYFSKIYPRCEVTIQLQEGDGGYAKYTTGQVAEG
ncbi:MAG: 6-pyruvoyl trahydropterin synthase family protein [bacterium]